MTKKGRDLILPFWCGRAVDGDLYECTLTSPMTGTLTRIAFYRGLLDEFTIGAQEILLTGYSIQPRPGPLQVRLPSPLSFSHPIHPSQHIRILTTQPTKGYLTFHDEPIPSP